jgi:hypothetical protein
VPAPAGAFQSATARRALGAHYTGEAIIGRVLRPLLLDELWAAYARAADDAGALAALARRVAAVRVLDPACGRGDFLRAALRELRALERAAIARRAALAPAAPPLPARAGAHQLHGIELDEAAARAARALLGPAARIRCANALRVPWEELLPAASCTAVVGNPPFVAKRRRSRAQAADHRAVLGAAAGGGELDHAAAWFELAARYAQGTSVRVGFVATSSLVQGEQVAALWPRLLARGMRIDFAHRPFPWTPDAAVHVVVVGFSDGGGREEKLLYQGAHGGRPRVVARIGPYLAEGPDVVVRPRRAPLGPVPPARFGSMPNDGGHLVLGEVERAAVAAMDPVAAARVRELVGARSLMDGERRWCLWLVDATEAELRASPVLAARLAAVRRHRAASARAGTRRRAATPALFGEIRQPAARYLCIPRHGAAARRVAPMAFAGPEAIAHDSTLTVAGAGLDLFGILQSAMFTAWLRAVGGRLKGDPRISAELVYNTFPWPEPGDRGAVERAAQAVLAARARHAPHPLGRLYDPAAMPADLAHAHDALDAAVDALYASGPLDDAGRLALLLDRYARLTA